MNYIYPSRPLRFYFALVIFLAGYIIGPIRGNGQTCPVNGTTTITSYPNTYYPGAQATVNAGAKSITVGAATLGSDPIKVGDILLIIQMQGANISTTNNDSYGDSTASLYYANGYLSTNLLAGNMEYVIATNTVPVTGGTLSIQTGLVNTYMNVNYDSVGQYRYQLVRVPVYYNLLLNAAITAPAWNGTSGGVVVLYAVDSLNFNGQTVSAAGMGFRGGAGRQLSGDNSSVVTDYRTMSTVKANGSKGEGIAGTPRYLNNGGALLDNGAANEGYYNGSYGRGAPANAGGGATDGQPSSNALNSGGGGGGNGGQGGKGGNAWSSGVGTGGDPGSTFSQGSASRLIMGGGGGAGTTNDGTGTPGSGFSSSGSVGGGIVIVMAYAVGGTGTINVNGGNANNTVANDGSGGAGAGGSALIFVSTGSLTNITVTATGGIGGTNTGAPGTSSPSHGPGGGGGGGMIFSNNTLNAASSAAGGANGTTAGGTSYGATSGSTGILTQNITQSQTSLFPSSCTILALEFINVTANNNNGMVAVGWEVAREVDVQEYIVEKSADGSDFTTAGIVSYKSTDNADNLYSFTDNERAATGTVLYYRIKEIDQSGQPSYSKIVAVRISSSLLNQNLTIYPNPVASYATISFSSAAAGLINMRLVDMSGRTVWQKQFNANAGPNTVSLDNPTGFSNGIYTLQWSDGVQIQNTKVLVNH